ncbi:uncharacterized protein LOC128884089 [Hylaeus volcanicus]|uniref:uncharacterized protein LOC128884089 n=1 Tax=Hylaeus volcanicus TaxID=313075 RepID=UPI0023B7A3ED|nr:uncharacterized protein LOC128884089 [Hylaeus volcanicus]
MEQFRVLYTRQKTQKYKKWNDGMLTCLSCNGLRTLKLYSTQENEDKLVEAMTIVEAAWKAALHNFYIQSPLYLINLLQEPISEQLTAISKENTEYYCKKKIVGNLHTTIIDKCSKKNRKNNKTISDICNTENSTIVLPFLHLHHVYSHLKFPLLN